MLTVKIKDKKLEARIAERAQRYGKSTQDYVNDLLAGVLPETKRNLSFKQLVPKDHGYVLDFDSDDQIAEEATPFSDVTDTVSYTKDLRQKAWREE